ncbi:MAG: hypothetical protein HY519_01165 [Candidatus Aenigmarchaeota archaeon]|nr:hypothetical protein [Candidatus Aenigmarchaeota archaeon]
MTLLFALATVGCLVFLGRLWRQMRAARRMIWAAIKDNWRVWAGAAAAAFAADFLMTLLPIFGVLEFQFHLHAVVAGAGAAVGACLGVLARPGP